MDISRRLYTVATAVTPGNRVADIGTDHGYVPIFLIKNGLCPSAIAMDINQGPLDRATLHIAQEGLTEKIDSRLSDGMMRLECGEADSIVIAGMGGDLICRILRARKDILQEGVELILQPQSEWFKVRHALHEEGYQISDEWFLKEDGKYYVILKAIPGKQKFETEAEYAYGAFLSEECYPIFEEYLKKEKKKREEIILSLQKKAGNEKNLCAITQRIEEIREEIQLLEMRLRAGR